MVSGDSCLMRVDLRLGVESSGAARFGILLNRRRRIRRTLLSRGGMRIMSSGFPPQDVAQFNSRNDFHDVIIFITILFFIYLYMCRYCCQFSTGNSRCASSFAWWTSRVETSKLGNSSSA